MGKGIVGIHSQAIWLCSGNAYLSLPALISCDETKHQRELTNFRPFSSTMLWVTLVCGTDLHAAVFWLVCHVKKKEKEKKKHDTKEKRQSCSLKERCFRDVPWSQIFLHVKATFSIAFLLLPDVPSLPLLFHATLRHAKVLNTWIFEIASLSGTSWLHYLSYYVV